jgi:two-component system, OmpR family, phosphate regulon response regulator OmpR
MTEHILIIDDDQRLAKMVGEFLGQSGYSVAHALTAAQGLAMLDKPCSFVVLDLMLPDMDGLEVCRRIRALPSATRHVPILMLTAKGDPMDRIIGLEMGADDYLPKPFEPRELLARIRAILRRRADAGASTGIGQDQAVQTKPVLQFGSLEINPNNRQASLRGELCDLTSYQFDLLLAMAERAGRVLSREQIMEAVRGRELEAFDRSIDVHMGRIRLAIEADSKEPQRILTVRGVGYVFAKQQS